jgi:uncharacterized membrane protein YGL010W
MSHPLKKALCNRNISGFNSLQSMQGNYLSIHLSIFYLSIYLFIYLSLFMLLPFEHWASVKRFVSFQFLNITQSVGLLWTGDVPVARPLSTQVNTNTK